MLTVPAHAPFSWAADLHYSQAVAAGELIFTAGQGGFGADGSVVDGGFEPQLRQTFANLKAALDNDGATLASVAKLTVYLLDAADYDAFKRVRSDVFSAPYPASTAICVAALLVDGMRVEIDAVAVRGARRSVAG